MKDYDENIVSSYISYLDANNLYGLAMSMKLPYKDLKWCSAPSYDEIMNYAESSPKANSSETGYFLEVDLEYPKELHDLHNDYPLAPEVLCVNANMTSEITKEIYKAYHEGKELKNEKTAKLILNLNDKARYVLHIRNLKYYLEQGLKLKKIHRCVSFLQREWLKPYIDFNTEKRKKASNDFEKDMFKLMNNAVYGKTMEDVRGHIDFELVSDQKRMEKCLNSPTLKHRHIIHENLVGVEKMKATLKLNKPIYVGVAILDLSKLHMYKFYYDVLKKKYQDNIKLLYTDTDSFIIQTQTEDVYDDFKELKGHMDFTGYDKDHKCYDDTNNKVLGKFKDELDGQIMTEFIGLKPKMYCCITEDESIIKKAKGIQKLKVKKELNPELFKKTLYENYKDYVQYNKIGSLNQSVFSITQNKLGLSSFENKRYWIDKETSYAYGHHRVHNVD